MQAFCNTISDFHMENDWLATSNIMWNYRARARVTWPVFFKLWIQMQEDAHSKNNWKPKQLDVFTKFLGDPDNGVQFPNVCQLIKLMIATPCNTSHSSNTPPPLFKGGEVNFCYHYWWGGGESEKLKKGVKVWCRGRSSKGGRADTFSYLIFSSFNIFAFRNYFTLCKTVLCIWKKIIFFLSHKNIP